MASTSRCLVLVLEGLSQGEFHRLRDAGHIPSAWHQAPQEERALTFPLAAARVAQLVSAMTGAWPDEHGILLANVRQADGTLRPAKGLDRLRAAFWEILDRQGQPTLVVGWPTTRTGRTLHSCQVEAGFGFAASPEAADRAGEFVEPSELAAQLTDAWLRPEEVETSVLEALAPRWRQVDQEVDTRLAALAMVVAENASRHAAFLELLASKPWALATLCLSLPAELSSLQRTSEPLADDLFARLPEKATPLLGALLNAIADSISPDVRVVLAGLPHPERPAEPGFVCAPSDGWPPGNQPRGMSVPELSAIVRAAGRFPLATEDEGEIHPEPDLSRLLEIGAPLLKRDGETVTAAELWHYDALNLVATARTLRGDDAGALPFWEALRRLAPNDVDRALHCVECLRRLGRLQSARDALEEVFHPSRRDDVRLPLMAAGLEWQLRRLPEVRRWLEQVARIRSPHPEHRVREAILRLRLGEVDRAAWLLEELLTENPEDWNARFFLARCEIARRNWAAALEHALRCAPVGSPNPRLLELMAHAWHGLGRLDSAQQALEAACALAPNWPRPRAKRVLLARRQGVSAEIVERLQQEYLAIRQQYARKNRPTTGSAEAC